MNEAASHFPGMLVSLDESLEREFEEAVQASADLAVRVAFSILRRREDAEEIAQEAYARAYRRFRDLREPQQFRAWIVRVTWRLAIDRWRADRRRSAREQVAGENRPGLDVEEAAARAERSSLLWKAIDALPDKLRSVLILAALQGHDIREVAQLLDIPQGTVKSRFVPGPERAGREPDMSCERFREAIAGHAAGADLNPAAAAHLGSCEACAARLETQRRLLADVDAELAGTLSLSASPAFVARVTSSVSATRRRSIAWRPAAAWVGLAAAAAIVVVSLLRGPDPAVSPAPHESAVAAPAPAVAETGAPPQTDRPPAVRRSRPHPSRQLAAARPLQEPTVIVSPDQARAIARLRELMNAGRLTDKMLPPEQPHKAAELTVSPLEIREIKVPDVESIGRTPGSAVDQEPKEH